MTKIIPYGNFFIDKKDIFEVNKSLKNQFITSGDINNDLISIMSILQYISESLFQLLTEVSRSLWI